MKRRNDPSVSWRRTVRHQVRGYRGQPEHTREFEDENSLCKSTQMFAVFPTRNADHHLTRVLAPQIGIRPVHSPVHRIRQSLVGQVFLIEHRWLMAGLLLESHAPVRVMSGALREL